MKKRWVIGIDEVGRGPLAGPVTVAAVAAQIFNFSAQGGSASGGQFSIFNKFPMNQFPIFKTIKDSKKLSALQRRKWNKIIRHNFLSSIQSVSPSIIDRKGISHATRLAVSRCLQKLATNYKLQTTNFEILLDGGLHAPPEYMHQQTIIKGDERVPIIAAASIVAKVHRDRYMVRLHKKYPMYGFDRHKGYGTVMHREAIQKHGLSEYHRQSFCQFLA
ncbi:MAG: ribonuclease HII [Parcubacteria group bacterium Gr01-1014_29]|nr:MAG: ribonuclease HII [Parcubacteria group bacterium Gr01-1014_29]